MWTAAAVVGALLLAAVVFLWLAQDIEVPNYSVERAEGPLEIRDYPALIVAEVQREGPRLRAIQKGFGPLAGYIFAKGREGERIAMTAPVTQVPAGDHAPATSASRWHVRFIMPADYTMARLPRPTNEAIRLQELPAARRAAIRFSGVATDALLEQKEAALRAWIADNGFTPIGAPEYAYYNDPITPGFLRRNEVLIQVAAGETAE